MDDFEQWIVKEWFSRLAVPPEGLQQAYAAPFVQVGL
jgi:hypothetical protein